MSALGPTAMVMAAGLGTRLQPYTLDRPKALVEVDGVALLDIQLRRLHHFGFRRVVVNIHAFADMMEDHLRARDYGMEVLISDERDLLRDTGGGLLHAAPLLAGGGDVYVCNVDVLSDLDPLALMDVHARSGAWATLALRARSTDRYLIFDGDMRLCGWENRKTGAQKGSVPVDGQALAFSGQHVIAQELLAHMGHTGVFSVIDTYLGLAATGRIRGWLHTGGIWMDVGKPAELAAASGILGQLLP